MRDPADVIADALYRLGLDQGNDAANGAVDVLLALRDEDAFAAFALRANIAVEAQVALA